MIQKWRPDVLTTCTTFYDLPVSCNLFSKTEMRKLAPTVTNAYETYGNRRVKFLSETVQRIGPAIFHVFWDFRFLKLSGVALAFWLWIFYVWLEIWLEVWIGILFAVNVLFQAPISRNLRSLRFKSKVKNCD